MLKKLMVGLGLLCSVNLSAHIIEVTILKNKKGQTCILLGDRHTPHRLLASQSKFFRELDKKMTQEAEHTEIVVENFTFNLKETSLTKFPAPLVDICYAHADGQQLPYRVTCFDSRTYEVRERVNAIYNQAKDRSTPSSSLYESKESEDIEDLASDFLDDVIQEVNKEIKPLLTDREKRMLKDYIKMFQEALSVTVKTTDYKTLDKFLMRAYSVTSDFRFYHTVQRSEKPLIVGYAGAAHTRRVTDLFTDSHLAEDKWEVVCKIESKTPADWGEQILTTVDKALQLKSAASSKKEACCAVCKKTAKDIGKKLSRCSQCKKVIYCSQECQREDWHKCGHSKSCKAVPKK